jgi:hypothetical protein
LGEAKEFICGFGGTQNDIGSFNGSLLLVVQLVSYKVFSDFIFSIKNFDMKGMNAIAREVLNLSC